MKTKWRQRLRGTCKWGGVTLSALVVVLWVASIFYEFRRIEIHRDSLVITSFIGGAALIFVQSVSGAGTVDPRSLNIPPGWTATRAVPPRWNYIWLPTRFHPGSGSPNVVVFPLWLPFLLIALPTGYLFWSDHRRRMRIGCCEKCGYDLTGNKSGMCPECGMMTVVKKD